MRTSARAIAHALGEREAVDLVASFAAPWSHALALTFAGHAMEESEQLVELAREVFTEAARATSRSAATESTAALRALAQAIGSDRSPLLVQGFVALAHTLPLLLAGAWHALVMQPGAWESLRRSPGARTAAIDELLRLASPARVVFRRAVSDVTIGTTRVAAGGEVILALREANRCPERFEHAEHFVADRFADGGAGCRHVALGRHPHACAGGALVRLALEVSTSALLDEFDRATLAGPVTWLGGFAIDGLTSLPVRLERDPARTNGTATCPV